MWQKSKPYLFVLPTVGAIGFLFFGGLFEGVLQSFGYFPAANHYQFKLSAYRDLIYSKEFWDSLLMTFRVAAISSLTAGILGIFVSVCLFMLGTSTNGRQNLFWHRFFQLPLIIPHLVGAYLMVLLFMESGWFSRVLASMGLIKEITDFPILINEPYGWGIIFTYAWKEAPFISLMVYPVLLRIHHSWVEVARVFGADQWNLIREIVLPLIMPAWISATFIVFAFTFSAFEVPYLLGVTYPRMLPVYSFHLYTSGGLEYRPQALAVNVILAFITALLGILAYRISKRWSSGEGGGWG
jgi:putative spermidine/putrescine transport system permease protein